MSLDRSRATLRPILRFLTVPWSIFVAAFLYYVVVTLAAIGLDQLADVVMAAAYSLPVLAYLAILMSRGVRAVAALPLHIGHLPNAVQR